MMKDIDDALHQLGSYPRKAIEKIPILRLYQAKKRQAKQEVYKTAISDIILAHCFCMWNFLLSSIHFL